MSNISSLLLLLILGVVALSHEIHEVNANASCT
jgi:hypothetical protein